MVVEFDRSTVLGQGADGTVFLGTFKDEKVAVKRIQIRAGMDVNDARQSREEEAMKKLEHPYVLKLIEVQKDLDFKYFILELCRGTVKHYIEGKYTDPMPSEIDGMIQMASGLQYIHSQQFVHRDIKPANVMISESYVLKISDFGFCRPVTASGSFSMSSGAKGTKIYNSPEFHDSEYKSKEEKEKIRANVSTDIFSLGCLFHSYITKGGHPFAKEKVTNEAETIDNIRNGERFLRNGESGLSNDHYAFSMIDGMTEMMATDRWKLDRVLETLESQKLKLSQE